MRQKHMQMFDWWHQGLPLWGHQSKKSHCVTVYVMAKRLLGFSIYIIAMVQGIPNDFNYLNISVFFNVIIWSFGYKSTKYLWIHCIVQLKFKINKELFPISLSNPRKFHLFVYFQ